MQPQSQLRQLLDASSMPIARHHPTFPCRSRDGRWVAAGTFTSDVKVGGMQGKENISAAAFAAGGGAADIPVCPSGLKRGSARLFAQVYEVTFDRLGAFTGVKSAMSLKGHKSKVGWWRRGRVVTTAAWRQRGTQRRQVPTPATSHAGSLVLPLRLPPPLCAEPRCSAWTSPPTSPRQ